LVHYLNNFKDTNLDKIKEFISNKVDVVERFQKDYDDWDDMYTFEITMNDEHLIQFIAYLQFEGRKNE